jgi:hypothetical protein
MREQTVAWGVGVGVVHKQLKQRNCTNYVFLNVVNICKILINID